MMHLGPFRAVAYMKLQQFGVIMRIDALPRFQTTGRLLVCKYFRAMRRKMNEALPHILSHPMLVTTAMLTRSPPG